MCIGMGNRNSTPMAAAQPLPPVAPAAPTMADPAVQGARLAAQRGAADEGGLASTRLTVNLGGQGAGKKKMGAA